MTEKDAPQVSAPDGIWSRFRILPVFILVIPPLLVAKLLGNGHWVLFFGSFIPGALSVALWPPRTHRSLIAGLAVVAALVIFDFIAHFAGWK